MSETVRESACFVVTVGLRVRQLRVRFLVVAVQEKRWTGHAVWQLLFIGSSQTRRGVGFAASTCGFRCVRVDS